MISPRAKVCTLTTVCATVHVTRESYCVDQSRILEAWSVSTYLPYRESTVLMEENFRTTASTSQDPEVEDKIVGGY